MPCQASYLQFIRSCPIAWCRSDGSGGLGSRDQAGTAESLMGPVSLTAATVSSVM